MLVGCWLGCRSLVAGLISEDLFGWLDSFGWEFRASLSVVRFILIAILVRGWVKVSLMVSGGWDSQVSVGI